MSKCKINIKVGEESIELTVDSSQLPNSLQEFRQLFKDKDWKNLVDKIDNTLKSRKKIGKPSLSTIQKQSHIIPNTTIGALTNKFTDIKFPEDSDQYNISDQKVLFVNSYSTTKGELKYGLFKNPNGEQIIIVDRNNIQAVANYLMTMKSLRADHILKNIDKDTMKDELQPMLQEVKKHISNVSSIEDMLINFLQNRSKYRDINVELDGQIINTYAYLDELVGNLLNISSRRSYNDPTINNISHNVSWNKNFKIASLSIDQLYKFLPTELKAQIQETIGEELNIDKFKEYFSGKFNDSQLISLFGKTGNPYELLIENLISKEPEFIMEFKEVRGDRIYMQKYFQNMENQFGIGFEQIKEFNEPEYYNGKYILTVTDDQGISKYYVTRHYTTEKQRVNVFDSLEEAHNYINDNVNEPIVTNSFIEFHTKEFDENGNIITDDNNLTQIRTSKDYEKGILITVLDYDVPNVPLNMLTPNEAKFISTNYRSPEEGHEYATREDFSDFLQTDLGFELYDSDYNYIYRRLNTPEKIALFVMGINNPNTGNGKPFNKNSVKNLKALAKEIDDISKDSTKRKYYYVESSYKRNTKLIPVKGDSVSEYKTERKTPVIQLWTAASQVLGPKLGIDIEILTEPEQGKEDKKAYIKGSKVYINLQKAKSSDLFHEYAHIMMAYLKNNKDYRQRYLELINRVWEAGKKDIRRDQIEDNYRNYSQEDKMEEYFVERFGNWINNNAKSDFSNIFATDPSIKEASNLFSTKVPLTELYGSSVEQVFKRLNSDLARFFDTNEPLMSSEYKNMFKASRQKSQWIREQIENNKLEEYDCV